MKSTKCIILVCVFFLQPLKCNAIHWKEFHVVWDTVIILYSFNSRPALCGVPAFVSTKAVLVRKSRYTFGAHKPKAPLCKGSCHRRWLRDCSTINFALLQSLRLASQATSLYTREAYYRTTVHLKGVTHYTMQDVWKGVQTNRPYSFCRRAGVHLPPFY